MEQEKKEKLKSLLLEIGDAEDKKEVAEINKLDRLETRLDEVVEKLETSTENLTATLDKQRSLTLKASHSAVNAYTDSAEMLAKKLDQVAGTISSAYEKNKAPDVSGFFKDIGTQLAQIGGSSKKTSDLITNLKWNSSMGVRNTDGSPIDPAVAYKDATATPSTKYGTALLFDNAGTWKRVTNSAGLPVEIIAGSVSITSPGIAGLEVNLTKVSTPILSGVKVVLNGSTSAISVSATDLDIRNLVFATDKVDASGSTLGANSGVDVGDVTVNNASGASAVNIQDGGNSITVDGTVTATISSPSIAGLQVSVTKNGKSIKSVTGIVTADTDIVNAVAGKRIKVIAYSLLTTSTTAGVIRFQSNASTNLWTTPLQSISSTVVGSNLSIEAPSFLFATTAGEKLTLDLNASHAIVYNVTYFDDDAT